MNKCFITILTIFISLQLFGQTSVDSSFTYNSANRLYSIRVPQTYNPNIPSKLMVGMHGNGGSGIRWRDELKNFTDSCNMLLLCPDGLGNILDDTTMTDVLIDSMITWYNVDTNQVFICGFSNGGKAVYTYGLDHSDRFAGYMPIGAFVVNADLTSKRKLAATNKPFTIVHGANDVAQVRFHGIIDSLNNYTTKICDTLLPGVGHTTNFQNKDKIFTDAFKCLMTYVDTTFRIGVGPDLSVCGSDSINIGSNVSINAGKFPYTYSWSPSIGLNDSTLKNPKTSIANSTNYVLSIRDADGNILKDTIFIEAFRNPVIVTSPDDTICVDGETITVKGAQNYLWSPTTGLSCGACSSTKATISTPMVYTVIGTDSNGCKGIDSISLGVFPKTIIETTPDTFICKGDTGQFNTTGGVSYRWGSSDNLSDSSIGNPQFFPTAGYFFSVYGTDTNGCEGFDLVWVGVKAIPEVKAGLDTIVCNKSEIQIKASGLGVASYEWSGSTAIKCASCPTTTLYATTSSNIIIKGTAGNGCSAYDTISISVLPPIPFITSKDSTVCEGEQIPLFVNGGKSYKWSPNSSLSCDTCNSPIAFPKNNTKYQVIILDTNGCSDTGFVNLTINPKPSIVLSNDTLICFGDTITLSAASSGNIKWAPNNSLEDTLSNNPRVWPRQSESYVLTATSSLGCLNFDTIFVTAQNPVADFNILGTGSKRQFDPAPSVDYDRYSFDFKDSKGIAGTDEFIYSENGVYNVCLTVSTTEGCESILCKKVEITTVDIQAISKQYSFRVFPNPAHSTVTIQYEKELVNSSIYSFSGELIQVNGVSKSIDISALKTGSYILEITSGEAIIRVPLIKTPQ